MNKERNQGIYDAYINGDKVRDIAERFGVTHSYISQVAKRMGAPARKGMPPRVSKKTCPKCHRKIEVKDAKFCCYCGSDIRSARDLLIERVKKASELISFLPAHAQDELRDVICDVIAELKK